MSRRRAVWSGLLVLSLACGMLVPTRALAAEHHGVVSFNGVPVPGALVTATQGSSKLTAVTNDLGVYAFPDLPNGAWTIEVQMTGFTPAKQEVTSAPDAAADTIELKPMTLEQLRAAVKPVKVDPAAAVGAAPATSAPAPVKETATGEPAASAANKAQQQAAALEAAAPPPPPPQDAAAQQASDGFLINGSVNNAATSQYAQSQAIGNARTNGRSLYNWGLSAVLGNSALDAKPYSLTTTDSPKPSYTNMQLGANFGGPLHFKHFLPLGKGPYVYLFYTRGWTTNASTGSFLVPTLTQREGDLSGTAVPIYAPAAGLSAACLASGVTPGQPFAGNRIPAPCISASAQRLLKLYPSPNLTSADPRFNFQTPLTDQTHTDEVRSFASRNIGRKDSLNGNFSWTSRRSGTNNLFGFHDATEVTDTGFNVSWNHRITQRLNTSATYNYTRDHSRGNPFFAFREDIEAEAGIAGVLTDPAYWGPPSLGFTSGFAPLTDGISSNNRTQTQSVGLQVSWTHGRHEVAAGGDFRRQQFNYLTQTNPRGSFNFTGAATSGGAQVGKAGSDLADLLLGVPDTSAIAYGNADKYLRQSVYDAYVRDNFRVTPELTINAGVRWEYGTPITELKNRLVNLDFAAGFGAAAPVVATNPTGPASGMRYPRSLIHPDRSGILPNVSVAWRPISGSSLLVRSSYQWYNDTSVYQATALAMAQQAPLSTSLNLDNTRCPLTLTDAFSGCPSISPDSFAVDPNFRVGYAQIWQLSLQRDLPMALQVTATYRGTKGTRGVQEILPNTYPYGAVNPCPACPIGFSYRTSNGNSTREEGILNLRRRLRNGFTSELRYTYSKSLDDDYSLGGQQGLQAVPGAAGAVSDATGGSMQLAQDWRNPAGQRGLSSFDQRHVLSLSAQYTTGMGLGGHTLLSGWRGVAFKEWTVQATLSAATGMPLTPIYAVQVPGTSYANTIRPNYNDGAAIHTSSSLASDQKVFLNAAAFSLPNGTWGTARRNSIEGPGQFGLNASLARTFKLHDRYSLEAHFDATNVLNRVSYSSWFTTLPSALYGTPTGTKDMRKIQATFRLRY